MGRNQHSKDRLFVTATEVRSEREDFFGVRLENSRY